MPSLCAKCIFYTYKKNPKKVRKQQIKRCRLKAVTWKSENTGLHFKHCSLKQTGDQLLDKQEEFEKKLIFTGVFP